MATGIFCTVTEVQHKAGANASSVSNVEAFIDDFTAQAESEINVATQFNWSDAYGSLDEDNRDILKEAASNLAAIYVINYDMSGYTTTEEAVNMMLTLRDGYLRCVAILREKVSQDFLNAV